MTRWQRTKLLDDDADIRKVRPTLNAMYKAIIGYLNRTELKWRNVDAHLNLYELELLYNEIIIDSTVYYADQELLDELFDILMYHNRHTFSEDAIALVDIGIDRSEPLGSYEHMVRFME